MFDNIFRLIILNSHWDSDSSKICRVWSISISRVVRMWGYHNVITYSNASAPREEWCLLLKSLSKCVAEVSKLFWSSNVTSWSEIATHNKHWTQDMVTLCSELTSPQTHSASEQAGADSSRPSAPERGWGFAPGELTSASRTSSGHSLCQSENGWVVME